MIQEHWNKVVREERPPKYRNYIRSSEIGMSFADRYQSMLGTPITNPFNERTLRIFDAGKVIEFIVVRSLAMAGILKSTQDWLELSETEDHLKVVGKLDALVGGFSGWDDVQASIDKNLKEFGAGLDDGLLEGKATSILEGLKEMYPHGLPEPMLVEVKSINSMAFWKKGNRDEFGNFKGYNHNKLQLYAYLEMSGIQQGILLYVSKDDFTVAEIVVSRKDDELREKFYTDITRMTSYFKNNELPTLEPELVFNESRGIFEVNWNVSRSLYLSVLYGYQTPEDFEKFHHQTILDINRALKHIRIGKIKAEDYPVIEKYNLNAYATLDTEDEEEI
jgi:hypothetical protein